MRGNRDAIEAWGSVKHTFGRKRDAIEGLGYGKTHFWEEDRDAINGLVYGETHFWKEIVTQSRAWGAVRCTFWRKS